MIKPRWIMKLHVENYLIYAILYVVFEMFACIGTIQLIKIILSNCHKAFLSHTPKTETENENENETHINQMEPLLRS